MSIKYEYELYQVVPQRPRNLFSILISILVSVSCNRCCPCLPLPVFLQVIKQRLQGGPFMKASEEEPLSFGKVCVCRLH